MFCCSGGVVLNQVRGPGPQLAYRLLYGLLLPSMFCPAFETVKRFHDKTNVNVFFRFPAEKSVQVLSEAAHCWEQSQAPAGQLATPPADVTNFLQVCQHCCRLLCQFAIQLWQELHHTAGTFWVWWLDETAYPADGKGPHPSSSMHE